MQSEREGRTELEAYSLEVYNKGWVANHDGNLSVRLRAGLLITPTATSKRRCDAKSMVVCDAAGTPRSRGRPPSELALHRIAYTRPDVGAVIHVHSPWAMAFGASADPFFVHFPEAVVSLGTKIPCVPRLLPKAPEMAPALTAALDCADVVLLEGNGSLAVGPDLETAFLRLELLEHLIQVHSRSLSFKAVRPLSDAEQAPLLAARAKAGLARPGERNQTQEQSPKLRSIIADEVRRALGEST